MKPKTAGCDDGRLHPADQRASITPLPVVPNALNVTGFVHDARIITMRGQCRVQDLKHGDRVVSRDQGSVVIRRIEQVSCIARAIYVLAGSLGHIQQDRDSLLPAGQPVLVRDWRARTFGHGKAALMRAGDLVDHEFVRDLGFLPMTLYRVICDTPQVLYADGLELGTADARCDLLQPQRS